MTGERPLLLASTAALVTEALAGFLLLAVSVWFISACAVAGQAAVAVNFNYVAPATMIRLLAILRIGAGYGDRYLGHLLLLQRLARRRHELLEAVFDSGQGPEHARATATLQQAAEDWAARYSAVVAPQLAATLLFTGLVAFVALLLPALACPLLALGAVLLALRILLQRMADRLIGKRETNATTLDRTLERWLRSSSLWSLHSEGAEVQALHDLAASYGASRRQLDALVTRGEDLLLGMGLLTALVLLYAGRDLPPTPLATVPVLVVAALRDWLRPALNASVRGRDTRHGSAAMFATYAVGVAGGTAGAAVPEDSSKSSAGGNGESTGVHSLILTNFRWQRGNRSGAPLTAALTGPGLYLLTGSSGTGKTSLFEALAGELAYTGSAQLDGAQLCDLAPADRRRRLYLAEQFGHVFSDTLGHNLRLAAPEASDVQLVAALSQSGFTSQSVSGNGPSDSPPAPTPDLRQWLGEQGRPLSGGERKRLLLARAFLRGAPVWLLDEPFEGIDDELAARIAEQLNAAAREHLIIVATHRQPPSLEARGSLTCG